MSRGTHRLIREGASLVESPEEILAELQGDLAPSSATTVDNTPIVSELAARVRAALQGETLGVDDIARRVAASPSDVLVVLVELELADLAVRAPGGLYRLASGPRPRLS